ncbi:hypothetical protein [Massilia sp. IC2-476]|uniref:hypothetical protein n=1 Tax=Massilia sp. IC2-476 TaxID=2887199 RepID=UPI001D12A44C|nr:hypothetical protein [Massilia sp. IC2-476]MCC2971328.1 hypothetical protein [Massilia sp. IC2-476]
MLEPWVKQAFAWAAPAALLACAALAGYVYHLQRADYDRVEERRGVIEQIRFSQTGRAGQLTRMPILVVTVRPLGGTRMQPQELSTDAPSEVQAAYFQGHRVGNEVAVWVDRRSGRIVDVLPPAPPDFAHMFLILLPTLGLLVFLILMAVIGHSSQGRSKQET